MSDKAAPRCRSCEGERFSPRLDLGEQPLCNRFLVDRAAGEYRHPLRYGRCEACGLVQVLTPAPVAELRPRFPWLTYREPEAHLPDLADRIAALPGLGPGATVGALSYKDDSTLALLAERGLGRSWRVDPDADLGLGGGRGEIESIQERLTPEAAGRVLRRAAPADVLLARHVLEHVDAMGPFLAALRALLRPGGYLVVESPDCGRAFRLGDCTTLWEEHLSAFTPASFRAFFPLRGFRIVEEARYPYPFEDSLVAIARPDAGVPAPPAGGDADEAAAFASFVDGLPRRRALVRERLAREVAGGGEVALLGAGHAACTFLNLFGLAGLVSFVADDDPNKAGLFMPGSRLPILPSRALLERGVRLCLLAVGSSAEGRVVERNGAFLARGGRFASIYPASPLALDLGPAGGEDAPARPLERRGDAVWVARGELVVAGPAELALLRERLAEAPLRRNRICAHPDDGTPLQEMIVQLSRGTYIRPHRHRDRAESLLAIEGEADAVFFGEGGEIEEVVRLGPPGSGRDFFYRTLPPRYHTLVLRSERFVFLEATTGPFRPETTAGAPWAPAEGDTAAVERWERELGERLRRFAASRV